MLQSQTADHPMAPRGRFLKKIERIIFQDGRQGGHTGCHDYHLSKSQST